MEEVFNLGDKVVVPWGLDELPGEVVEVHASGLGQRIVVRVEVPGAPPEVEDTLITLPANALTRIVSNETPAASGSWAPALHYERQVLEALQRVLPRWGVYSRERVRLSHSDRADFVIRLDASRRLYVEAKYRTDERTNVDAVVQLAQYSRINKPIKIYLLLVTNGNLTPNATGELEKLAHRGVKVQAVTWRSMDDDMKLSRTLEKLLTS